MTEKNSCRPCCQYRLCQFRLTLHWLTLHLQLSPHPGNANPAKWEDPLGIKKATTRFSIKSVFSSKLISVLRVIKRKQITARLLSEAIN